MGERERKGESEEAQTESGTKKRSIRARSLQDQRSERRGERGEERFWITGARTLAADEPIHL